MAKKKAIKSSSRSRSSSTAKRKPRAGTKTANRRTKTAGNSKPAAKRPAKSNAARRLPPLSNQQVGEAAGYVWHALATENGQSLLALKDATNGSSDLVLAAVGWLAREGKLEFAANGRSVKVWLRADEEHI